MNAYKCWLNILRLLCNVKYCSKDSNWDLRHSPEAASPSWFKQHCFLKITWNSELLFIENLPLDNVLAVVVRKLACLAFTLDKINTSNHQHMTFLLYVNSYNRFHSRNRLCSVHRFFLLASAAIGTDENLGVSAIFQALFKRSKAHYGKSVVQVHFASSTVDNLVTKNPTRWKRVSFMPLIIHVCALDVT